MKSKQYEFITPGKLGSGVPEIQASDWPTQDKSGAQSYYSHNLLKENVSQRLWK